MKHDVAQQYKPRSLRFEGGSTGLLLLHGLSSSPLELQFLARGLQMNGFSVNVPVIPGYTYQLPSQGENRFTDWLATVQEIVEKMCQEYDSVAIGGLCAGAVLAIRLTQILPNKVSRLLALSTVLHFDGWGNPWYSRLLPLARVVPYA